MSRQRPGTRTVKQRAEAAARRASGMYFNLGTPAIGMDDLESELIRAYLMGYHGGRRDEKRMRRVKP